MNTWKLNKLLVLGLVLLFLLPAAPGWAAGSGNISGDHCGRAAADHNGTLTISDFGQCQLDNVVSRADGLALAPSGPFTGLPEFEVSPPIRGVISTCLAVNSLDDFILVRSLNNSEISGWKFDRDGNIIGNGFLLEPTTSTYGYPSIAIDSEDGLMLEYIQTTGGASSIYVQRYDRDLNPAGSRIEVTGGVFPNVAKSISPGPGDSFTVAWMQQNGSHVEIALKRFDSSGAPIGEKTTVSLQNKNYYYFSIAKNQDGVILAVWNEEIDTPTSSGIINVTYNTYAEWFDAQDNPFGDAILVGPQNQSIASHPMVVSDHAGDFLICWHVWQDDSKEEQGQWFDARGNRISDNTAVIPDVDSSSLSIGPEGKPLLCFVGWNVSTVCFQQVDESGNLSGPRVTVADPHAWALQLFAAMDSGGNLMVTWVSFPASGFNISARYMYRPVAVQGSVVTPSLAPGDLFRWSGLTWNALMDTSGSLSFDFSIDGGASWKALPSNRSLAAAGNAPLRLRAYLSTRNNIMSPVLKGITLNYVANRPPIIVPPQELTGLKHELQNISAQAVDPDGGALAYNWTQTGGLAVNLTGASTPTLQFTPAVSGDYIFRLVVNDGYNDSAPVTFRCTVQNSPPEAILKSPSPTAKVGASVTMDASGSKDLDGNITAYNFDYGDGSQSGWANNPVVRHAYARGGRFNVTVTVLDDEGASANSTPVTVTVQKASSGGSGGSTLMLVAAVIIVVILVAVLAAAMMRRKKPTTVIQYQAPAQNMPRPPQQQVLPRMPPVAPSPQMQPAPQAPPPQVRPASQAAPPMPPVSR